MGSKQLNLPNSIPGWFGAGISIYNSGRDVGRSKEKPLASVRRKMARSCAEHTKHSGIRRKKKEREREKGLSHHTWHALLSKVRPRPVFIESLIVGVLIWDQVLCP